MKAFHIFILFLFVNLCSAQILIYEPLVDDSFASSGCLNIKLGSVESRDRTLVIIEVKTNCTNQWISLSKRMTLSYSGKENGIIEWGLIAGNTLDFDKKYTLEPNRLYFFFLSFPPIPQTTKIISINENIGANSFYWKGIHLDTNTETTPSNITTPYSPQNGSEAEPKITPEIWSGTGWAIKDGHIVTNNHVIEGAKQIKVYGVKGRFDVEYNAYVVATDKKNDLAVIKIEDNKFNGFGTIPYSVKKSASDVGEDVFVLGYPLIGSMGKEIKLTTGVISAKTGFLDDVSLYQISAPIQPGNSGGPLFDNRGNVIGIVNSHHTQAQNASYAVKTSLLNNLLESVSSTSLLPLNNTISNMSLSDKVKNIKDFVYLIVCSNSNPDESTTNSGSKPFSKNTRYYPSVNKNIAQRAVIKSVTLERDYTAVEIISNNQSKDSYYAWCSIEKDAYIIANGKRYTMTKAEGIRIAPEKTYFSQAGQDITFTLYFPPIPASTTSIDLIESADSDWRFYGIKIK
ncbi:MAG: trypsin-like peptidase domain-containing protein [Paludibacteraceae bacterium]|nr:trypsin-like peptidase domain-containing protein [Paludibacteraceae bacterium]